MSKLNALVGIAAILFATNVHAELDQWIGIANLEDGGKVKAAPNTIKPVMGDRVSMWILETGSPPYRLKNGKTVTYSRKRYFADCNHNSLGIIELVAYEDDGSVAFDWPYEKPDMMPIQEHSVGEFIFQFACNAEYRNKQILWYASGAVEGVPDISSTRNAKN